MPSAGAVKDGQESLQGIPHMFSAVAKSMPLNWLA